MKKPQNVVARLGLGCARRAVGEHLPPPPPPGFVGDSTYLPLEREGWDQHSPGPKLAVLQSLGPLPPSQPGIPLLTVGEEMEFQGREPRTRGAQLCSQPQLLGCNAPRVSREYIIAAVPAAVKEARSLA